MNYLNSVKATSYQDFLASERAKDEQALKEILRTRVGREAYSRQFHVDMSDIDVSALYRIPDSEFNMMSDTNTQQEMSPLQREFISMGTPR